MATYYPDLNDDVQQQNDLAAQKTAYNATGNSSGKKKDAKKQAQKGEKNQKKCGIIGAQIWVSIVGVLTFLLGLFFVLASVSAKFGPTEYEHLNTALPSTGGVWMIFGFGLTLSVCSVVLILAACFFDKGIFKTILVVFAVILSLLLVLEVASAGVMLWGLNVISLPDNAATEAAATRLLEARNKTVYATYYECCVEYTPPYQNMTIGIPSACKWPENSDVVKEGCGSQNVFECVCEDSATYGSYIGKFLSSKVLWVGVVTIVFAILLLIGLITTCALVCHDEKKTSKLYTPSK